MIISMMNFLGILDGDYYIRWKIRFDIDIGAVEM